MTLTFDLFTSKSNQFTFVLKFTIAVNLVKFYPATYKISCSQTFGTHGWTDRQPENNVFSI